MTYIQNRLRSVGLVIGLTVLALAGAPVYALATTAGAAQANTQANQQQHLQNIISRGNQEIARRLASLDKLTAKINATAKLSATDKTALTDEVNTTASALTTLKTKLDAETTVAAAGQDASTIVSDYRIYALVLPKVYLVKTADDEQVTDTQLAALATKLQARLTTAQQAGKSVTSLQATLANMTTQTSAAQAIASSIEAKVSSLQPSDYNTDHTLLSGDAAQLKTAHADNVAAYQDAKTIIAGIKAL